MKKIFLLLVLVLTISCERQDENSAKELLMGNWEWISSTGGIDGRTETPTSTGKSIKLIITKDSVKLIENGNLIYKNSYIFTRAISIIDHKEREMIIYKSGIKTGYNLQNSNNLLLTDECYDCFASSYKRVDD